MNESRPRLEWKRVYRQNSRKVSHYVAKSAYYNMTLEIHSLGGFITVKQFFVEIYHRDKMILRVSFFKKRDAEEWADALFSKDGAKTKAIQLVPLYS